MSDVIPATDENMTFFEGLRRIETLLSDLYRGFSERFPGDAEIWAALAEEELAHHRMLGKAENLFSMDAAPRLRDANLAALKHTLRGLVELVGCAGQGTTISRADALRLAISLEKSAAETHYHFVFNNLIPSSQSDLLSRLQAMDKNHSDRIQKYLDGMYG